MKPSEDKNLLLKWLDKKLSSDEKKTIDALPNMELLAKAIEKIDTFEMPSPDLDRMANQVDQKRFLKRPKPFLRRYLLPLGTVAAVIIGAVFWFISGDFGANVYQTVQGQQLAIVLPDQSTIQLNTASSIQYFEKEWPDDRQLTLKGSAYFKVKKGSTFKVETALGDVQVLGTQFEVLSRDEVFEVLCFEGKVHLHSPIFDTTIIAGQGFISQPNQQELFEIEASAPAWLSGTLTFRKKKLSFVFDELERQYAVKIDYSAIRKTELFTGTVPLDNLDLSLNIVCTTMGLKHSISSKGVIRITK